MHRLAQAMAESLLPAHGRVDSLLEVGDDGRVLDRGEVANRVSLLGDELAEDRSTAVGSFHRFGRPPAFCVLGFALLRVELARGRSLGTLLRFRDPFSYQLQVCGSRSFNYSHATFLWRQSCFATKGARSSDTLKSWLPMKRPQNLCLRASSALLCFTPWRWGFNARL